MQFFGLFMSLTGKDLKTMAENKEELVLSEEEIQKVDASAKIEGFAQKYMNDFNEKIVAEEDNAEVVAQIQAYMDENTDEGNPNNSEDGDGAQAEEGEGNKSASSMVKKLLDRSAKQEARLKTLEAENKKLAALPEGDESVQKIKANTMKNPKVAHSKTHLFASNTPWNAFEGRPWNASVRDGKLEAATDWNDPVNIQKINTDLGAYARQNSSKIFDLLMDGLTIPSHWEVISGVSDEYVFLSIVTGDITQGFKAQWLPKNNQEFIPIKNKIFDIQIDASWTVTQLKQIERSYLQQFFNNTSSPYKDDFVAYLSAKLIAKARKEDKIAVFKGVHYKTPEDATKPGRFINKMDGMLKVISGYRGKAYKPHTLGALTEENIYDKVNAWVKSLPYDFRLTPGLKLGLSDYWHKAYHNARERAKGTNNDYVRNETTVEQFNNVEFVPHAQLEGQDFMYITTSDNLGIMINKPGEENTLTIEKVKRNIDAYADYKLGFFVKALGATDKDGNALGFDDQVFFSNEAEVLQDVYVPAESNDATPSVKAHNALIIGSRNTAVTNITKIDDIAEGQYVYLFGDSDNNVSTVKSNTNILLDGSDFALSKGNLIRLRGLKDGKAIEISRTESGEESSVEEVLIAADATTADAAEGTMFVTGTNTKATAITDIVNAVPGEKYTIKGGSDGEFATTIANGGKFFLTAAITLTTGVSLTVEYNGSKFIEFDRA